MLGNIFERYGSCLRGGLGTEIFFWRGGASLRLKYADEIFTGRYFVYYYIEELIMRIGSKMREYVIPLHRSQKIGSFFHSSHPMYKHKTCACSHLSLPILVALPNSKAVEMLRVKLVFAMIDGLSRMTDVCSHQISLCLSLEPTLLSLSPSPRIRICPACTFCI